jgi:hypothetical protein
MPDSLIMQDRQVIRFIQLAMENEVMKKLLLILCMGTFLTACGGDDQDKSQGKVQEKAQDATARVEATAPAPAVKSSAPPVTNATVAKEVDGSMFVDHTRDIKEFQLRRSLFGVESLIENNKQKGIDTKELESQRDDLVKQIKDLISG